VNSACDMIYFIKERQQAVLLHHFASFCFTGA